jgi:hypothetical protein
MCCFIIGFGLLNTSELDFLNCYGSIYHSKGKIIFWVIHIIDFVLFRCLKVLFLCR